MEALFVTLTAFVTGSLDIFEALMANTIIAVPVYGTIVTTVIYMLVKFVKSFTGSTKKA